MNNIFNIYKGVPNPTQLVLAPRVNTDLSSAKIEIFSFFGLSWINKVWIKVNGIWKECITWVKINGVWKKATPKIKNTIWK